MQMVYLEAVTYCTGMNVEHWYGKLVWGVCEVELLHRLSAAEARALSRKDNWHWEKGDRTSRFARREKLVEYARRFCGMFIPGAILLDGRHYTREPMEVLNEPAGLDVERLNTVWEECERLGWWDSGNDRQVGALSKDWFEIVERACK